MSATATATPADALDIRTRVVAAVAAIDALLALPREERASSFRPLAVILPELHEARELLGRTRPDLEMVNVRMADGSGFAEVRSSKTYGVVLSSERYPNHEDRVASLTAAATVARAVLDGALD